MEELLVEAQHKLSVFRELVSDSDFTHLESKLYRLQVRRT